VKIVELLNFYFSPCFRSLFQIFSSAPCFPTYQSSFFTEDERPSFLSTKQQAKLTIRWVIDIFFLFFFLFVASARLRAMAFRLLGIRDD
jgi:hypothetical protein